MGTIAFSVTIITRARAFEHFHPNLCSWKRPISLLSVSKISNNFTAKLTYSSSSMATPLQVHASSTVGAPSEELYASSSGLIGANDLLIVGPGVLGRIVAEKWREEHPGCLIFGETVTMNHHEELIKIGISPSLKGKASHKFPYVIFCAPPTQTSDYPGDVR
ncbi:unnamed protein product [Ilex paraguariensis]|uniref:Uncharacterized protein n=1 Tax=Ilex paraguariensis TaxID=185542 RepID=A0ABC8RKM4_9AQUA